jgi:hypothetical protein
MGNYEQLKQSVSDVIKTNGNQEITGSILQNVLLTIISSVGANSTFAGVATPTTNPGTPDGPVFYLASESGTYSNFGSVELQDGLSVLMWNGSWSSQQIFSIDNEPTAGSDNLVKSGGVYTKISELGERIIPKEIEKTFTTQTASFKVDEYQENIESYIEIKSGNDSVNTLVFFNVGSGVWNKLLQVAVNNGKTYKVIIPATTNIIQVIHRESQGEKSCKLKISYIGTIPYDIDELGESVDDNKINIANNTRDINDLRNNYVTLDVSKQEKCEILNANVSKSGSRYLSISKGVLDLYIKREGGDSNLGLCSVIQSGNDYVLAFYEVDEAGNFIDAMKGISIRCKKLKGSIYYAFDVVKINPSYDSDILTISVIVDMDVLGTFSGYGGVMLNEDVFKEHIGLIDELKESENIKEYESRIAKRNVYVAPLIFTGLWMQNGIIKSADAADARKYAIYAYKVEKNKTYRAECEIPNYADNWDNIAFVESVDDIEAGNAIKQLSTGGTVCAGIDYTATEDGYLLVAREGRSCRVCCYEYAPSFEQNAETVEMPNKVFAKDDGIKEYTSPQFTPDTDKYVFVNLNNFVGNVIVKLYGVDGDVLLDQKTISSLDYKPYSFDAAFYPIYGTPPQTSYYVTIEGNFVADIVICQYKGKPGNVYENIVSQDNQLEELSRKIDATSVGDKYRIAPNGKKYLLQILNTGNVIGVPVIPNKALFIGNSLLMGQGNFGMNATSINNDYYWRLNLKSSNFQNKTNEEILNNDLNTPEKIDNKNNLIEKKVNNSSNDNLLNNESPNKNNNNKELMTSEDNNMKVKQFLDNDNRIEKEEDLIPNISAIENKNSTIKIDSSKKENLIENNNIDNKENIDSNIKRKYLIHEPNILNSTKIQALKRKISNKNNKKINENENKMKQPSFIKDNNFVNFNTNNNIKNKLY